MSLIDQSQTSFDAARQAEAVVASAESPSDNGGEYEQCQEAIRRVTDEETRARLSEDFWRKMLNGPR
ncbi:hypothetical protein KKC44_03525 [Patescibacteria group bacterium]|nr:hypothetical protein [Patescibacteria group bacterium]MBU2259654.1 hypothetical protein [Patescibacteria group bacterium]